MISFSIIANVAADIVKKRRESGNIIGSDDTVCVLCTNTGNIYTGISGLETINGMTNLFHAETDAVKTMMSHGESVIESVSVFSSLSLAPILPCNSCLSMIVSLTPENINTVIVTPSGNIKITDIGMFAQNPVSQPQYWQPGFGQGMNQSVYSYNTPDSAYMNNSSYMYNQPSPAMQNSSVYIGGPAPSAPVHNSANNPELIINTDTSSYNQKAQSSAGNDLLKNKLSGLLDEEDDDDIELDKPKKKRKGLFRR